MADIAGDLGGELRTNPAWAFLRKPVATHNQGGCRMSDRPQDGVVDPEGRVHGRDGLYILDGATLCTSVGVNPSATIAAIAERNVLHFIRARKGASWPSVGEGAKGVCSSPGAARYHVHTARARQWAEAAMSWQREPPRGAGRRSTEISRPPLSLVMREWMHGYFQATESVPDMNAGEECGYWELERQGRPDHPIALELRLAVEDLMLFYAQRDHSIRIQGTAELALPGHSPGRHDVEGRLLLFTLPEEAHTSRQRDGWMTYELEFRDRPTWKLSGYKRMKESALATAWRDTTSLFFGLSESGRVRAGGVTRVDLARFLHGQIRSIEVGYRSDRDAFDLQRDPEGNAATDPAQAAWAIAEFGKFFFGNLQRIYLPELQAALVRLVGGR